MNTLLKKVNKKYHTLVRVWNCMYIRKRCVLINFSQFSYCPLLWNSRTLCNRVKQNSWKSCKACLQKWNISVFATEKMTYDLKLQRYFPLYTNTIQFEKLSRITKTPKPQQKAYLRFRNRKRIFACPQNMGNNPKQH